MASSTSSRAQNGIQEGVETGIKQQATEKRMISAISEEKGDKEETTVQAERVVNEMVVPATTMNLKALELYTRLTKELEGATTYTRLPTFDADHDAPFRVKTTALFYLRALNIAPDLSNVAFQLAANVDGAGHMGDLVFKLALTGKFTAIFIHFQSTPLRGKLVVTPKMLADPESLFSLKTCYQSYCDIKKSMAVAEKGSLFDLTVDDCVFATYTNARGGRDLGSVKRRNLKQLLLCDRSLRGVSAKVAVVHTRYREARYHRFYADSGKKLGDCLQEEGVDGEKFLSRFRIFTRQPELDELDLLIRDELRKIGYGKFRELDAGRLRVCFLEKVKEWWEKGNVVLDKNSDILERAVLAMNGV